MRIVPNFDFVPTSQTQFVGFCQMLAKLYRNLANAINGNLTFGDGTNTDNISGAWASVTTPGTPNTDFVVNHNLGRAPVGYLVMEKSAACDVYTGSAASTTTQITLRATVAGVNLKLFIC